MDRNIKTDLLSYVITRFPCPVDPKFLDLDGGDYKIRRVWERRKKGVVEEGGISRNIRTDAVLWYAMTPFPCPIHPKQKINIEEQASPSAASGGLKSTMRSNSSIPNLHFVVASGTDDSADEKFTIPTEKSPAVAVCPSESGYNKGNSVGKPADVHSQSLLVNQGNSIEANSGSVSGEEKSNRKGETDRWLSTESEEDVFYDAIADFTADPLSRIDSIFQRPKDPSNDSHSQSLQSSDKVEDQMENGRKEDLVSSSDMPSLVDSNADKFGDVNSENTQIGENITEEQVSQTNGDNLVETFSSAIDSSAGKISSEESEIDPNLEKINGIVEQEISPDTADPTTVLVTDVEAKEAVLNSEVSQPKISPIHNEGCTLSRVIGDSVKEPSDAHSQSCNSSEANSGSVSDGMDQGEENINFRKPKKHAWSVGFGKTHGASIKSRLVSIWRKVKTKQNDDGHLPKRMHGQEKKMNQLLQIRSRRCRQYEK